MNEFTIILPNGAYKLNDCRSIISNEKDFTITIKREFKADIILEYGEFSTLLKDLDVLKNIAFPINSATLSGILV